MAERTFLIAGLGNPGLEYAKTRHNIGYDVCDAIANQFDGNWEDKRFAWISDCKWKGRRFLLIKPTTYMNLSGRAVIHWMKQIKVEPKQILVITDDINLEVGQIRLKAKGSDGGHNGLRNIQDSLGSNNYPRLRFGVGNDFLPGQQVDYVLGKWNPEDTNLLNERVLLARDAAISFGLEGLERAMNKYNGA